MICAAAAVQVDRSWSNNDHLPWLVVTRHSDDGNHRCCGPSSPSRLPQSAWVDPDTVVPPPGRAGRAGLPLPAGRTTVDGRTVPDRHRQRHTLSRTPGSTGRRSADKFDERDEERLSPLSWLSRPNTEVTCSCLVISLTQCATTIILCLFFL